MHSHSHSHSHHGNSVRPGAERRMVFFILLTLGFAVVELAAGLFCGSLALVSDAGHNFADAISLFVSGYALWVARRPANSQSTFGYHRVGILAALANAVSLLAIAIFVFWEAYERFRVPHAPNGKWMMGVSAAALALNGLIGWAMRPDAKHDLNLRSAYLHMLGDALSAMGVIVAGAVAYYTQTPYADPVVSILIGILMIASSWGILGEAINVLLENVPSHLDMTVVESSIRKVPGVVSIHDLHVWSVTSGIIACSCHVMVTEQSVRSGQQVLRAVARLLKDTFSISHTTVQIEVEGCEPDDMYCKMHVGGDGGHDHPH